MSDPTPAPGPRSALFSRDGYYERVNHWSAEEWAALSPRERPDDAEPLGDGSRVALRIAPRWEVPEVLAGPQPEPIEASVGGAFDRGCVNLERKWALDTVQHCRLCAVCVASLGRWSPDPTGNTEFVDVAECSVYAPERNFPEDNDEADAYSRLWSEQFAGPLRLDKMERKAEG